MDPSPAPPTPWLPEDGEEWELRHDDDGFTYKILKRLRLSDPSSATEAHLPPAADAEAKEENRRERRRKALLKVRTRYQEEIHRWELLSNTLRAMQERERVRQEELQKEQAETDQSARVTEEVKEDSRGNLIEELFSQAEAQELIIRDVANLCDVAEAMCSAQEEQLVQAFIDLPVWSCSPQELMAALSDD